MSFSSDQALSHQEHAAQLRRAVIASTIGTTIEWYDFFLYSTVTGLVFAKLFFPHSDPLVGTLEAFAVYAVGFAARPIGAAIFGHWGDRLGRKSALIATLMLMGIATFLVGLVPTYDSIGIWGAGPADRVALHPGHRRRRRVGRFGAAVDGMGAHQPPSRLRRVMAAIRRAAGLFLANLAVLVFSSMSGDAFITWGWRMPFLISIVLVGIGLWIRLGILETPTFRRLVEENRIERAPIAEVFRLQSKEVFLSAFARMAEQAPFYIFTAFVFAYGVRHVEGVARLAADRGAGGVAGVVLLHPARGPSVGPLRAEAGVYHRRDRSPAYSAGSTSRCSTRWCRSGSSPRSSLSLIPHDIMYGPQAALIAESFTGRLRYSGASIGYQLASIIAGGPAPLIAAALFATYHSWVVISIYITVCSVISVVSAALLTDYTGKDISAEYAFGEQ